MSRLRPLLLLVLFCCGARRARGARGARGAALDLPLPLPLLAQCEAAACQGPEVSCACAIDI